MGLRERKREQTRQALTEAAVALFAERGYDATTIADIADRAGVSARTFFAYHPSKEHVLFCDHDEQLAGLTQHVATRAEHGLDTLAALRAWIMSLLDGVDLEEMAVSKDLRREVIDTTPVLAAHERQLMVGFELIMRAGIAEDLGEAEDDMRPRLVAATAAAALEATRAPEGVTYTPEEIIRRLDQAFVFLRSGLDALASS